MANKKDADERMINHSWTQVDVMVMTEQLRMILGKDGTDSWVDRKLGRLLSLMRMPKRRV
jgi:hypothetical protein